MYKTLSYLPEVLLNQTYETYIKQHIFKALNMTRPLSPLLKRRRGEHSLMDSYLIRKIS